MAKKSEVQRAIDKLSAEIEALSTARDVLIAVQREKPTRKPQAVRVKASA